MGRKADPSVDGGAEDGMDDLSGDDDLLGEESCDEVAACEKLIKQRWVVDDMAKWTIFEDLEDELAYHRRRSRALCHFVRAMGVLRKDVKSLRQENKELNDVGADLQEAYERLLDEVREASGEAAYWRELAAANGAGAGAPSPAAPLAPDAEAAVVPRSPPAAEAAATRDKPEEVETAAAAVEPPLRGDADAAGPPSDRHAADGADDGAPSGWCLAEEREALRRAAAGAVAKLRHRGAEDEAPAPASVAVVGAPSSEEALSGGTPRRGPVAQPSWSPAETSAAAGFQYAAGTRTPPPGRAAAGYPGPEPRRALFTGPGALGAGSASPVPPWQPGRLSVDCRSAGSCTPPPPGGLRKVATPARTLGAALGGAGTASSLAPRRCPGIGVPLRRRADAAACGDAFPAGGERSGVAGRGRESLARDGERREATSGEPGVRSGSPGARALRMSTACGGAQLAPEQPGQRASLAGRRTSAKIGVPSRRSVATAAKQATGAPEGLGYRTPPAPARCGPLR